MLDSRAGTWDRVRQTFADQFEQDGTNFVYRRSQKGVAINVTAQERGKFIDKFGRDLRRAKWLIYGGLTITLGVAVGFTLLMGSDLSQIVIFIGVVTSPLFFQPV